ncbi:MAG: XdhC family protein [Bacteroidota bacterium]|nr:XdhC family protein [Bacteroidota bacterium]
MKQVIYKIPGILDSEERIQLITILSTHGSAPQVPGSTALFSKGRLMAGTLGGGVLEGDAMQRAERTPEEGASCIYSYELNSDIDSREGAICGGSALLLLDAEPAGSKDTFIQMDRDLRQGKGGVLVARILGSHPVEIQRAWFKENGKIPAGWESFAKQFDKQLAKDEVHYQEIATEEFIFLQPLKPLEELIIAGAGHIGKALCHMASLLDFRVTVIDPREEYANPEQLPDAGRILVNPVGDTMTKLSLTDRTYIVIVTRGHQDDAAALRACVSSDIPYIGMIGSRRKVKLMREEFIKQSWATAKQFDRVHAPVGLEINSNTVQEIALSIAAQLVQVRNREGKDLRVQAVILAAGESLRMGKPKMLLPFGDGNMIENVVGCSISSLNEKTTVVLGANAGPIEESIGNSQVEIVQNENYRKGMLSSLQCGLKSLSGPIDGMMVLLGDQPLMDTETLNRLILAFRRSTRGIFIATYQGKRGHPVLISRKFFNEILNMSDQRNLRDFIAQYPEEIEEVESDQPGVLKDIDTEQEYQEELNNLTKRV